MSDQFKWTTEDDSDWEGHESQAAPLPEKSRRRPWGRWGLLALLLVGLVALLWQRANEEVTAVAAAVETDVLSSQALLAQATAQDDLELFVTLLSGRDLAWTEAQQALFQQDLLWDRRPFGLSATAKPTEVISITLAPDLQSAELWVAQQYHILGRNELPNTITLSHPLTFRRGEQRWLLAPPPPSFWGSWGEAQGNFVTLIYPERDEMVALRLLREMDTQVMMLCRREPMALCQGGWRLTVRLDTDPASLAAAANPNLVFQEGAVFKLPTPSLVGWPLDEAGYAALAQGYVAYVLDRAIVEVVAGRCCAPLVSNASGVNNG